MRRLVVIGAGLGGLCAGIRLACSGFSVTVLEKNARVGGKLNLWQEKGYTFDTGPTLLTMPGILEEFFRSAGARLEDTLELLRLDPICRYHYPDGAVVNAFSETGQMEEEVMRVFPSDGGNYRRFMAHAEKVYDAAAGPFLFSPFLSSDWKGALRNLGKLRALLRIDAFRTLDAAVSSYFRDPRLRQLFNRFATYNGSSPYRAPATLVVIPHVEFRMGGWYIRGGMYRLADALLSLANRRGVEVRTGVTVTRILERDGSAVGVETDTIGSVPADAVIANADALYTREHLLPAGRGHGAGAAPSLSGFVLMLGVRRLYTGLAHHNIFFSPDYEAEFQAMVQHQLPAMDPTVYVALSCRTDSSHAPRGSSNMFVLVNAPPLSDRWDWERQRGNYRDLVLGVLANHGVIIPEEEIETEQIVTPLEFASRFNAYRGALYGTSSNSRMSAFLRPPNRARELGNLFYVGGSAHPGGGIPLVFLSGKHVADLVSAQWTHRSPGGRRGSRVPRCLDD